MTQEVSESTARDLARCGLPYWLEDDPVPPLELWGFSSFEGITFKDFLAAEPLRITDVHGNLLFFEFADRLSHGREIRITASAIKDLGAPIVRVEIRDDPLPLGVWIEQARKALGLRRSLPSERIVCHAYPRYGLLVPGEPDLIYDFMYRSVIEVGVAGDGLTWSPLERVPASDEAADAWQRSANAFLAERWDNFFDLSGKAMAVKPAIRKGKVPVKLEAQNHKAYCSPAAATMILRFHGFDVDQETLVTHMETVTNGSPVSLGTAPDGELKGYRDIVKSKFSVIRDEDPQFDSVLGEIFELPDQGRPLKDGANIGAAKHARTIAGWKIGPHGREIYVCDPLPVRKAGRGGRRYWEAWGKWAHTDFLYVR